MGSIPTLKPLLFKYNIPKSAVPIKVSPTADCGPFVMLLIDILNKMTTKMFQPFLLYRQISQRNDYVTEQGKGI